MLPSHANVQRSATAWPAPRSDIASQPPLEAFMPLPSHVPKEEEVTTIRPPASAHLMIDSLDRYSKQAQSLATAEALQFPGNNFKLQSQEALLYGYFTRLAITQVYLKYNAPTIVDGVNNTFSITQVGSATATIQIATGFYTGASLAAELQSEIQAVGAPYNTYTVIWNPYSQALQISSNNAASFYVNPVLGGLSATSRCQYLLGVHPGVVGPANAAADLVFAPARLYFTSFVDIVSERLTKYQRVKDSESSSAGTRLGQFPSPAIQNIVARVYLVPPNQRILDLSGQPGVGTAPVDLVVDYNTPKHIRWSPNEAVYELDFQLYDQFGQPLYWDPQYPTEFLLTCVASET